MWCYLIVTFRNLYFCQFINLVVGWLLFFNKTMVANFVLILLIGLLQGCEIIEGLADCFGVLKGCFVWTSWKRWSDCLTPKSTLIFNIIVDVAYIPSCGKRRLYLFNWNSLFKTSLSVNKSLFLMIIYNLTQFPLDNIIEWWHLTFHLCIHFLFWFLVLRIENFGMLYRVIIMHVVF